MPTPVAAFVLLCVGLVLGAGSAARLMSAERLSPISPGAQNIALFNGTNLAGFYTWLVDTQREDPRAVYSVTNGLLRISGDGLGYLSTKNAYRDYHLVVEFKWGEKNWPWGERVGKARDSGLFLHSFGPDGNSDDGRGAFKAALECNLFQGATGDLLLIRGTDPAGELLAPRLTAQVAERRDGDGWFYWKQGGRHQTIQRWGRLNWFDKDPNWRDVVDFRGPRDIESPPGQWTRVDCLCQGTRIIVKVNGQVVNEAFDVFPASGQILLQCEGSEIFFRKIELLPLPKSGPAP